MAQRKHEPREAYRSFFYYGCVRRGQSEGVLLALRRAAKKDGDRVVCRHCRQYKLLEP
jgi:hypothetical protein